MKDHFQGWYPKTPTEVAALWEEAIFVADANVLLHCLRHPSAVRNELLRLFGILETSLWIPYQVGLEFHRNRLDVELGAQDAYETLSKDLEAILDKIRERLRQLRAHPTISVEKELAILNTFSADFRRRMMEAQVAHPGEQIQDAVAALTKLLEGKVGNKWTHEQLIAIKKEGEDRYGKKIPPGFKDAKKDIGEFDKFGDLIIWKEMIAKAKHESRPIIFITDDVKEDWWWIHRGRKIGPRPELTEEFKAESGQEFHIYEFSNFLRFAADRFSSIKENAAQVEESILADEKARRRQLESIETAKPEIHIHHLEDERDDILARLSGVPGLRNTSIATDRVALRTRLEELDELIRNMIAPPNPPSQ